jgi:hypothetical protein
VKWRDVFEYAINPEVFMDEENIRGLLLKGGMTSNESIVATSCDDTLADLSKVTDQISLKKERLLSSWQQYEEQLKSVDAHVLFDYALMQQSAPLGSSLGVWLQGLSAPGVFEDTVHLKVLSLLADDIGVGHTDNGRKDKLVIIGKQLGLAGYTTDVTRLLTDEAISDAMFCLPALLFCLSRRSDAFGPELAGIDFALRHLGLLPHWQLLSTRHPQYAWACVDLAHGQTSVFEEPDSPLSTSRWILEQYALDPSCIQRVYDGIQWLVSGLDSWNTSLFAHAAIMTNPELAMATLLQSRAREAASYHQHYALEKKPLSTWFEEATADPFPLLDALGRSKLVRPKTPEASPLISTLLRVNQSMFRIFSQQDIDVIKRWISTLDTTKVSEPCQRHLFKNKKPANKNDTKRDEQTNKQSSVIAGDFNLGRAPKSLREAYYLLQGRALAPKTREFAINYVAQWLKLAKRSIDQTERSLPATYQTNQLREWLLDSHDRQVQQARQQIDGCIPSREDVIDQTLQLAPLTLIDGAWLQGFSEVSLATQVYGASLFEIYWDELGNGDKSINHPKIYRDVLAAMDITLAATGSHDFAYDPRFYDESFRLPVYWLCLGKLPVTYRLEILGMNLAMELSGVGGGYVSARRFLKHYKFPTIFVSLHNTIDNVSTGHSAWSADAIEKYMKLIAPHIDVDTAWHRVRTGYESLAPIVQRDTQLDYFKKNQGIVPPANPSDIYHHRAIETSYS